MTSKNEITFTSEDFRIIDKEAFYEGISKSEKPSLTYTQDVWRRLKKNHLAMWGLIIIVLLIIVALVGPVLSPYTYADQDLNFTSVPPRLEIRKISDNAYIYLHPTLKVLLVSENGELIDTVPFIKKDIFSKSSTFDVDGQVITVDYQNNPYSVYAEDGSVIEVSDTVWNKTYLMGSDHLGRDLMTRVIYGARISLIIGFVASIVNLTVGVLYGGFAGYMGGMTDNVMMRIVDIMRSIPRLLYVIIIMVVLGSGLKTVVLTIGLVYWLGMARIVRGQVLSLKNHEFVMAAKTMGSGTWHILSKHLIPNALGPIIVVSAMNIPGAIFTEAFLSFVGLGVSAPQASWGTLCNDALSGFQIYPYQLLYPAFAICITVLAFNFVGDGLRDCLDPRLRK